AGGGGGGAVGRDGVPGSGARGRAGPASDVDGRGRRRRRRRPRRRRGGAARPGARAVRDRGTRGRRRAPPRAAARSRAGSGPDRGVPGGGPEHHLREADARGRPGAAHGAPPRRRGVTLAVATLWRREVTRFVRQRSRVVGALAQPIVFWLLLGGGLSASFRPPGTAPGTSYLAYLYPGILVLVLLFTAIFATIGTVEDRRTGFLQGVLVAPVGRTAVVVGQALGATTLAVGQGLLFLVLAPLAGVAVGPGRLLAAAGVMTVVAFGLTNLGLLIAWRMESTQGFHAIMNLLLIPIWLLSGAFFP